LESFLAIQGTDDLRPMFGSDNYFSRTLAWVPLVISWQQLIWPTSVIISVMIEAFSSCGLLVNKSVNLLHSAKVPSLCYVCCNNSLCAKFLLLQQNIGSFFSRWNFTRVIDAHQLASEIPQRKNEQIKAQLICLQTAHHGHVRITPLIGSCLQVVSRFTRHIHRNFDVRNLLMPL